MKRLTLSLLGLISLTLAVGCCCGGGGGACAPAGYSPYGAPAGAYIQPYDTQAAFGQPVYGPVPATAAAVPLESLPTY